MTWECCTGSPMSAEAELEASAQRERELRKIVLSWLNRKGYSRAEEQFRKEAEIAGVHGPSRANLAARAPRAPRLATSTRCTL